MSKSFKTWSFGPKTYRFIGKVRKEKEYGYVEYDKNHYNILQVKSSGLIETIKNMAVWIDVEEEHVPEHAIISLGALGYTDWKSELHKKCRKELKMP